MGRASRLPSAAWASAPTRRPTRCASCPARSRSPLRPTGAASSGRSTRARETGHEVILQIPMEPFDYPDNDPGTAHAAHLDRQREQNLDRLHWLMSRFQGYVGIVNYMGGSFQRPPNRGMAPVLREAGDPRPDLPADDLARPRAAWRARSRAPTTSPSPRPIWSSIRWNRRRMSTGRSAAWRPSPAHAGTAVGFAGALPVYRAHRALDREPRETAASSSFRSPRWWRGAKSS